MRKTSNTNARTTRGLHTNTHDRARTEALIEEAIAWRRFAAGRTTLSEDKLERKLIESLAFSLGAGANSFAVPSKLYGTASCQKAIGRLLRHDIRYGQQLDAIVRADDLVVMYKDLELGLIQAKHAAWLRPLITRGAGVHLLAITGLNGRGYCGINIAIARAGLAAIRAEKALRDMAAEAGGDGQATGDEDAAACASAGGDGQATAAPTAVAPTVPQASTVPPVQGAELHLAVSRHDVRLWRSPNGSAHLSVPHVVHHSPTGPEWGYAGSGPKDAALSVLCAFTDVVRAERLAHDFTHEVIARIPREGGVIPAAFIARWLLDRSQEPS